jgi:hypothetical protein
VYSEENAVKMRNFKSFSLRLRLRRFSDGINRGIDACKFRHPIKIDVTVASKLLHILKHLPFRKILIS